MKAKKDYKSEILDIIKTKDWGRARSSNDKRLYQYVFRNKDIDGNCKIIWSYINIRSRDYESEVLDIIKTEDWDRAYHSNDINLYFYIKRHKDTDENCKIIWEHIRRRNYESEILDIIKNKDWGRARSSNNKYLYIYIKRHKDTDENCKIIWEHIKSRDYESEVLDIIKTEDWDRARYCNDKKLYHYIISYKDTDKNCRIIWEYIKTEREHHSIKDYLLHYFKHGKSTKNSNKNLCTWFIKQINRGNQCCIDIKNLIVAADTYKDPVALETLDLIKNHLEKEDT